VIISWLKRKKRNRIKCKEARTPCIFLARGLEMQIENNRTKLE
jgi:hypothetical protein